MRIKFQRRVSGLARAAWVWEEIETPGFEVLPPGQPIPDHAFKTVVWGIRLMGRGTFELRPGSLRVLVGRKWRMWKGDE